MLRHLLRQFFFISAIVFTAPLFALNWSNNFEKASQQAKADDKPMLIYFSGSWCIWCERLEAGFLNKEEFAPLANEMILVKIDYPRNTTDYSPAQNELKKKYKVFSFPTLVILSPKGEILGSLGYPRDSLAEYMAKIRFLAQIKMVQEKKQEEKPATSATTSPKEDVNQKKSGKKSNVKEKAIKTDSKNSSTQKSDQKVNSK